MEDIKKPRGRPVKLQEEKLVQRSIRLTEKQWAKVDQMGLSKLRQLIERWKAR